MATSGSNNYNLTRNQIILEAFDLAGIYGIGRTVSSEDMTSANTTLNMMIKSPEFNAMHLFTREQGVLFLERGQTKYTLGNGAYAALESDVVITELSSAGAASDTILTVDSTTGMAASDVIGISLDDKTMDWTTIVSVDSSTQITITTGLSSAASVNKNVYTYTAALTKPLKIHSVRRVDGVDNGNTINRTEIPLVEYSNQEYFDLPQQTQQGTPTGYYYNPNLTSGDLYLWNTPDNPEVYLRFTFSRIIEDFDASTNNPDFPSEWLECLAMNLAARLCIKFSKYNKYSILKSEGMRLLEELKFHDSETNSIYLSPERRY